MDNEPPKPSPGKRPTSWSLNCRCAVSAFLVKSTVLWDPLLGTHTHTANMDLDHTWPMLQAKPCIRTPSFIALLFFFFRENALKKRSKMTEAPVVHGNKGLVLRYNESRNKPKPVWSRFATAKDAACLPFYFRRDSCWTNQRSDRHFHRESPIFTGWWP